MTDNRKVLNYQSSFDAKVNKICKDSSVRVKFNDLEQLLKATKRCLNFAIMSDTYLGGGLTVDDKKIAEAYKNVNNSVEKDKDKILFKAERKVSKRFKVKG